MTLPHRLNDTVSPTKPLLAPIMKKILYAIFSLVLAGTGFSAETELPFLSPLFGEHMMLQRGQTNRLWGWAKPGTEVRVSVAEHQATAVAGSDGRWQAEIEPPAAGGPYTLTIDGPQHLAFSDVLVGDIWLCSGQSNMEFGLARARNGTDDVKQSTYEKIRLFRVAAQPAYAPLSVPKGEWRRCEPAAFPQNGGFSAVAYYFGRKVNVETGVPIGLIQAAIGGTPAESWTSPEALKDFPEFSKGLAEMAHQRERGAPAYGNFVMHWYDEYDRGVAGDWSQPSLDMSTWKNVSLKQGFTELGVPTTPAVVWFRREITLPDPLPVGPAKVLLGVVEKMDTVFINGKSIGASAWVENPRAYTVPANTLRPGQNLISIRVLKTAADGGFRSPAEALKLVLGDGAIIPLEGEWRGIVSVDAKPPHALPLGYENWPTMPSVLYFGMMRPLAPLALKGVLWYQGEANFTRAQQYRRLLPAMIADWRNLFGQRDLPFLIAGLPAFMKRRDQPATDGWTDLREAQALTAHSVPHTALATTVDTGNPDDIHPIDKQPVGERLALLALSDVYGKKVVSRGPTYSHLEKTGDGLRLHFTHTDGGLAVHGDRLGEFSVAGDDHVWHWADARIEGDSVIVSSSAVSAPLAVRYAWQANPLATLYNGADLPAEPFRTDNW